MTRLPRILLLCALVALATATLASAASPPKPAIYVGGANGVALSLTIVPGRSTRLFVAFTPQGVAVRRRVLREKIVSAFCAYDRTVASSTMTLVSEQKVASVPLGLLPQQPTFTCGLQTLQVVKTPSGYRPVRIVSARMTRAQTSTTGTDYALGGSSDRSKETTAQPLDHALSVLARPRRAADAVPRALIVGQFPRQPLAKLLAALRGKPGNVLPDRSRLALRKPEQVWVVPTMRGWICFVSWRIESCHRGLLRQGVAWSFYNDSQTSLTIYGLAARDVASIELVYGRTHRNATLTDGVFMLRRPIPQLSGFPPKLPPLGYLLIHYRDHNRHSAAVELR